MKLIKLVLLSVIVIDFLGLNITLTLLPALIMDENLTYVPAQWSYQIRLFVIGVLTAIYPFGQFMGASMWGKLSDQIGRKNALLAALTSTGMGYLICAGAIYLESGALLLIGRLVTGFSAGNVAIVLATLADISKQGAKSTNFSLMQVAIGIGMLLGASLGGLLSNSNIVSWFNPSVPFLTLMILIIIDFILLYLIAPNTRPKKSQTPLNKNPFQVFGNIMDCLSDKSLRKILCIWSFFIAGMTLFGLMFPPVLAVKFHLNTQSIGLLLSFWAFVYIAAQILIIKPVLTRYKGSSLLYNTIVFPGVIAIILIFSSHLYQLYIAVFLYVISLGFVMPNLFTIISDSVSHDRQGQVLGVASSIQGLMTVIMTLLGGVFMAVNNSLTVLIGGGLMCAAALLYWYTINSENSIKYKTFDLQEEK